MIGDDGVIIPHRIPSNSLNIFSLLPDTLSRYIHWHVLVQ